MLHIEAHSAAFNSTVQSIALRTSSTALYCTADPQQWGAINYPNGAQKNLHPVLYSNPISGPPTLPSSPLAWRLRWPHQAGLAGQIIGQIIIHVPPGRPPAIRPLWQAPSGQRASSAAEGHSSGVQVRQRRARARTCLGWNLLWLARFGRSKLGGKLKQRGTSEHTQLTQTVSLSLFRKLANWQTSKRRNNNNNNNSWPTTATNQSN